MEDRGTVLIDWDKVCQPKDKGGIGVMDIATHNKCLLMKHLHKFFNQHDIPWVKLIWESYCPDKVVTNSPHGSFWWRNIAKLIPEFNAMAQAKVGTGDTIKFWQDNWSNGILKEKFPEAPLSLKDFFVSANTAGHFHSPLSIQAYQQFQMLTNSMQDIVITNAVDKWYYPW